MVRIKERTMEADFRKSFRLANDTDLPEELARYATNIDPILRSAAAANPRTPAHIVEKLAQDPDPIVRDAAKSRPLRIVGKNLTLRVANPADAGFILSLRTNEDKSRYLSAVQNDVHKQADYLRAYKEREKDSLEYYFIMENSDGHAIGTVRLYDFQGDSFCWGSWLTVPGAPSYAAIESALMVYDFAFGHLSFQRCHFDVRKGNEKVIAFHMRFGARTIGETELDLLFDFTREEYQKARQRYRKYVLQTYFDFGFRPHALAPARL
jgi:RimJ/RimL family protein N-acetyltransferase